MSLFIIIKIQYLVLCTIIILILRASTLNLVLCFVILLDVEKIWIHAHRGNSFRSPHNKWLPPELLKTTHMCDVPVPRGQESGRFQLGLCSGSPRAEIKVSVGCITMQRPLPGPFQLLDSSFPRGCMTKIPSPRFLVSRWPGTSLGSLPWSLLHNMATSSCSRPTGEHLFNAPPSFNEPTWLRQAHQDNLPLINPRSTLPASANPSEIPRDMVTGVTPHHSHRSRLHSRRKITLGR